MPQAIAIFLALLFLSVLFVTAAWVLVYRLTPEARRGRDLQRLLVWSAKGMALPVGLWAVMNLGICWSLHPFMPEVQAAQNIGGDWVAEYLRVLGMGMFIITSYWAAVTLGWTVVRTGRETEGEPRKDFKALCWTCSVGLLLPAALMLLLGGLSTLGLAGATILIPLAGYAPAILRPPKSRPMYARAVARMKFGKYSEAEWEIIRELEKREDDFEGWMMLAGLYANHFNDLPEAEQTILGICDQPRTTAPQLSVALQRLADWHLKLAGDPDAARRALQMICDRLPRTHLARMAQLRMNQLPATAEELREQQSSKPVPLPALGDNLDAEPAPSETEAGREQAAALANRCVERLQQDPNHVGAREKLARLFAERLDRAESGIEQLMLLLNLPDQPEARRAEWLGLIAAWHLKYRHDRDSGRKTLERVIAEFPHTPQALAARRRIELMDAETRMRR